VEKVDRALQVDHVCAYLLTYAYSVIRKQCERYGASLIAKPQTIGIAQVRVSSLDVPLSHETTNMLGDVLAPPDVTPASTYDCHALYQAIDALPPDQRTLITRLFGLHEAGIAQDIREISQHLYRESSRQAISRAFVLKTKPLNRLYSLLASQYPPTGDGTISPQRQQHQDYARLSISPAHQQRLAHAVADLQASGHKLTQNALEKVTHVRGPIVGAYLQQQGLAQPDREPRSGLALSEVQASGQRISGRRLAAVAGVCKATASAFLLQQAGSTYQAHAQEGSHPSF
jgi:hypothetical protein